MNTFVKISLVATAGRCRACVPLRIFFPTQPFQVFTKQTECKFPHCFLWAKGFPLYAMYARITRALCLYKMYLVFFFFFLFS